MVGTQQSLKHSGVDVLIDPHLRMKKNISFAQRDSEDMSTGHSNSFLHKRSHTIANCHHIKEDLEKIFDKKVRELNTERKELDNERCCCLFGENKDIVDKGIYSKSVHQRDGNIPRKIGAIIDSLCWTFVSSAATIISLFLRDFVLMTLPKSYDLVCLDIFLTTCVFFFAMELIFSSIAKVHFFGSFFFILDVVGTFSLLIDIPWVQNSLSNLLGVDIALLTVAKGGRMGRAARSAGISKMTTRMMRMIRMLRVVRTARCFNKEGNAQGEDEESIQKTKPSRVGIYLADSITKKIILIVLIMLISVSMMGVSPVEPSYAIANTALVNLELMESNNQYWANFSNIIQQNSWSKGVWFNKPFMDLKVVQLNNKLLLNGTSELQKRRQLERYTVETESGKSFCKFDQNIIIKEESAWNIILMIFVIIMFCFGSFIISSKANMLVVKPIEKMVDVVKSLTASLLKEDENENPEEEKLETDILQEVMRKVGMIFHTQPMETDGFNRKVFKSDKKEMVVTVVERARKSIFPKAAQRLIHSAFAMNKTRGSQDNSPKKSNGRKFK